MKGGGDLRRTLRLFGRFTVGQRRAFVSAFVLLALEAVTAVAVPDLIKNLTDFLIAGQPAERTSACTAVGRAPRST